MRCLGAGGSEAEWGDDSTEGLCASLLVEPVEVALVVVGFERVREGLEQCYQGCRTRSQRQRCEDRRSWEYYM
jgi:hypothetical protein